MADMRKFTKKGFFTWLGKQSSNKVVGKCSDPMACVLAQYIADDILLKDEVVSVALNDDILIVDKERFDDVFTTQPSWDGTDAVMHELRWDAPKDAYRSFELPRWAESVVGAFDRLGSRGKKVTAARVRAQLEAEGVKV